MKDRKLILIGLVLTAGWVLPGCRSTADWPAWGTTSPRFAGLPWDFFGFEAAPPVEIDLSQFPGLDLSGINADRFLPTDAQRILVAEDARALGLFNREQDARLPMAGRPYPSPDGERMLELKLMRRGRGLEQLISVSDRTGAVQGNWWSIGRITEIFWAPDGGYFGFNEQSERSQDRRQYVVIAAERQEPVDVQIRLPDAATALRNFQVALPESFALRGWVSANVVIIWIHGDYHDVSLRPQWGYEVAVDLAAEAGADNARLLRAFTLR